MWKLDLAERPNCIPWPPVIYVLVVVGIRSQFDRAA